MRLITPLCRFALSVALCLAVSLPAFSADTIHMTIESSKHGQLHNIPVTSASTVGAQSHNAAAQKGKTGQHGTIRISREIDANSPHLQVMMTTDDLLKQVTIEFERTNQGKQQLYRSIKLTNAVVTQIQKGSGKTTASKSKGGSKEIETITMTYEKIVETNGSSGKTATDSWIQK